MSCSLDSDVAFLSQSPFTQIVVPSMRERRKLLIANRGEIAVRILRTAKRLNIPTVAIYTRADATSPHVSLADEAVALHPDDTDPLSNSRGYLDPEAIVAICKKCSVTLVHPGYGFLSENAHFAGLLREEGITFLGPRPETIQAMGLKHEARMLAKEADVPLVPGSQGLVDDVEVAVTVAKGIGFPVMLKSTAGGGGMGLVVCRDVEELRSRFHATQERAQSLFKNNGVFLEHYYPSARHVEIQVFGNGLGHVIHMGERECSVQRRHQKVIEETPGPFMIKHPDMQAKMCSSAVRLCKRINYASAGTIEFLVDDATGDYFFLEMNTRLQVEHPITEAANPGLDIVELMIDQGIAERDTKDGGLAPEILQQDRFDIPPNEKQIHAIEARIYCENPAAQFKPSPGILQDVQFLNSDWLRVDTWVENGTSVTPFYDPLIAKLVVTAPSRQEVIYRLVNALTQSAIPGPPNNMAYLRAICESEIFKAGNAMTTFLENFSFTPRAMDVLSGGLETSVQDYPGRRIGMGIPRGGPMDPLSFRVANMLVSNDLGTEALEITLTGCRLYFHVSAIIAVTGAPARVTIDGQEVPMWSSVVVPARGKVTVGMVKGSGFRTYLAVRGGFPEIPRYLGSKSTSTGLGGYQGRALAAGDTISLGDREPTPEEQTFTIPPSLIPSYSADWIINCLAGPHSDEEFITREGIENFFSIRWKVSESSNRMGIRLEGPPIAWARESGGEGGSHPSNIHDNAYAFGTINVNGDTPVILTNDGPDMGGYTCVCTVATEELWKLGQLRPGNTVRFIRISFDQAIGMIGQRQHYFDRLIQCILQHNAKEAGAVELFARHYEDMSQSPKLHVIEPKIGSLRPRVVFRQAGDSAVLAEYGELLLDFNLRARIHAFEMEIQRRNVPGIWALAPCIRSTMIHFDPIVISQSELLAELVAAEMSLPETLDEMVFPARRITFPIVLNDRWNREALEKYMHSIRDEAVYLPSNIEYLARNNGLEGGVEEALKLLTSSDWLVFGVGFYLACPFLIPVDPRCRLVGQKMNPSRTYTPRGAVGIAGLVAAIYPIESPGGYQLYGRTLPPWQTWGKGQNFHAEQPWLLQPFDQVAFESVTEKQYLEIENQFDSGQYVFKIEQSSFSMSDYNSFAANIREEVETFKVKQAKGAALEEARERVLLAQWTNRKEKMAQQAIDGSDASQDVNEYSNTVAAPLAATIWKIKCQPGDTIRSADQVLLILEAMKTEINVEAEEENVGRVIVTFGKGVREGAHVKTGEVLVYLQ
ncbi:urea carboxylase [Laetiporus sulphureus 93-53]|uniref:Urea carboxylase n=1 Tax=Laetiporus sulphureus 93-53 TaxID=1314785 RepID=A0A165CLX2_9APHY|nr:urea carboxylase [Laetiporus sulphureus 93-53]KZT03045.1 urea carboxylase [Laetiporus sulphureus 93-53]